jgi:hypothetical protein
MKSVPVLIFHILVLLAMPAAVPALDDLPGQYCIVDDNWEKIFEEHGISIYSQETPDSDVLAFKAAGILHAPADQVMEVLRKVDITREWMPDISEKIAVKEFSDLEAITYSVNLLPWPFADREMLLLNKLRLDTVRKYLVVDVYSVDLTLYPVKKGKVRAHMYCGETLIRPVDKDRTEVQLVILLDPKGYIPAWLVNVRQKSMPYNFLRALEEKAGKSHYKLRPVFREMLGRLNVLLESNSESVPPRE